MEYLYASPLGMLLLGFSGQTLTALRSVQGEPVHLPFAEKAKGKVEEAADWLSAYFAGKNPSPGDLDFQAKGTAFQERVWKLLIELPYGYCVTYGFLARLLTPGMRAGRLLARAVGNALACNPIWIIIPCHRVIRSNGEIGQYAGGTAMKKALLLHEGVEFPASCLEKNHNEILDIKNDRTI